MVAAEPLEESQAGAPRRTQSPVPVEPAGIQGLSAEGKPDALMGLHLPWSHAQLSAALDGSTALAAAPAVREARRDLTETPGRYRQLLPNQGSHGCGGSRERQHPHAHQSWTW